MASYSYTNLINTNYSWTLFAVLLINLYLIDTQSQLEIAFFLDHPIDFFTSFHP